MNLSPNNQIKADKVARIRMDNSPIYKWDDSIGGQWDRVEKMRSHGQFAFSVWLAGKLKRKIGWKPITKDPDNYDFMSLKNLRLRIQTTAYRTMLVKEMEPVENIMVLNFHEYASDEHRFLGWIHCHQGKRIGKPFNTGKQLYGDAIQTFRLKVADLNPMDELVELIEYYQEQNGELEYI